jgi:putative DNA methylase
VRLFFKANDFAGRTIADPFMGGGTPIIEANRVGCGVFGVDVNPMALWIVREEVEHLDVDAYLAEARTVTDQLQEQVGHYYRTDCPVYGDADLPVKYWLWVKTLSCEGCQGTSICFPDIFSRRTYGIRRTFSSRNAATLMRFVIARPLVAAEVARRH